MTEDDGYLATAIEIGDRIVADERRGGDRLPWAYRLGDDTDENPDFVRGVGDSIYLGTAGIVQFLVALHRATGGVPYLESARRAGDWMTRRFPAEAAAAGLYIGQTGTALALLDLSETTGDAGMLAAACEQGAWVTDQSTKWLELMNGPPGCGLVFLELYRKTGDPRWRDAARRCVEAVRRAAMPMGDDAATVPMRADDERPRVLPGLAHGMAGVAFFLHAIVRSDPESGAGDLARRIETALRRTAHVRDGGLDWVHNLESAFEEFLVQWCHGAPGVAVAFLASDAQDALEIARACGRVTIAAGDNRNQASQCHGVCGNAEALIELYRRTGETAWLDEARRFAELARPHRLVNHGPGAWRTHDSDDLTYDLMTGIAGVGYFFLRLARPLEVPYPVLGRWLPAPVEDAGG